MSSAHPTAATDGATPDLLHLLDARGHRRSPAATPGFKPTRPPATKGHRYDPDPLPVEDVVKVLEACTPQRPGADAELSALRLRTMIIVLWRTGMRMMELLELEERDLERSRMMIIIRRGKGGKRRPVVMDQWGWQQLDRWLAARVQLPPGKLFCVLSGPTAGGRLHDSEVRRQLSRAGRDSGVRRRVHAHGLRHSHAADLWGEGYDVLQIQQQLGHAHVGITQAYLRGIGVEQVLGPLRARKPPMMIVPG